MLKVFYSSDICIERTRKIKHIIIIIIIIIYIWPVSVRTSLTDPREGTLGAKILPNKKAFQSKANRPFTKRSELSVNG